MEEDVSLADTPQINCVSQLMDKVIVVGDSFQPAPQVITRRVPIRRQGLFRQRLRRSYLSKLGLLCRR